MMSPRNPDKSQFKQIGCDLARNLDEGDESVVDHSVTGQLSVAVKGFFFAVL